MQGMISPRCCHHFPPGWIYSVMAAFGPLSAFVFTAQSSLMISPLICYNCFLNNLSTRVLSSSRQKSGALITFIKWQSVHVTPLALPHASQPEACMKSKTFYELVPTYPLPPSCTLLLPGLLHNLSLLPSRHTLTSDTLFACPPLSAILFLHSLPC